MARGLVLDVINDRVYEADIKTLDDYYKHIHCDCIDMARRRIGRDMREFDLWVDDEGLLKDNFIVSAVDKYGRGMLAGNIVFLQHDGHGNEKSLTQEEIDYLMCYITECVEASGKVRKALVWCEY